MPDEKEEIKKGEIIAEAETVAAAIAPEVLAEAVPEVTRKSVV